MGAFFIVADFEMRLCAACGFSAWSASAIAGVKTRMKMSAKKIADRTGAIPFLADFEMRPLKISCGILFS
jgi:hypothetical protein